MPLAQFWLSGFSSSPTSGFTRLPRPWGTATAHCRCYSIFLYGQIPIFFRTKASMKSVTYVLRTISLDIDMMIW